MTRKKYIKIITAFLEQTEKDKEYIESVINDPGGVALSGAREALEYYRGAFFAATLVLELLRFPKRAKKAYKEL